MDEQKNTRIICPVLHLVHLFDEIPAEGQENLHQCVPVVFCTLSQELQVVQPTHNPPT
jgi:hypothetical protein